MILRLYGGKIFSEYCKISFERIHNITKLNFFEINKILIQLKKKRIIDFKPKLSHESLTFLQYRTKNLNLNLKKFYYEKKLKLKKQIQ